MALFSSSRNDLVLEARVKYFDEGVLPTGLVSDAVFQSWNRCHRAKKNTKDQVEFQPVTVSRANLALQKNHILLEAWLGELQTIGTSLDSAGCSAVLTDATGVVVGHTPSKHQEQKIIPVAHRVGVNLSEAFVGTTAPGLVAHTGKSAVVSGAEHYHAAVANMYCAAAPIRNLQGQLAGILDISSEIKAFTFNPASVVGLYAASIENRFLLAQSQDLLTVKFQFLPNLIDTPMAGMLGFDQSGALVWVNAVAGDLLSIAILRDARPLLFAQEIFDSSFSQLASLAGQGVASLRLRSGVHIFLKCDFAQRHSAPRITHDSPPNRSLLPSAPSLAYDTKMPDKNLAEQPRKVSHDSTPTSFKQADADLIQKFLIECKGNVSLVAKKLAVSRGLIYRRMRELEIDPAIYKK